MKLIKAVIQPYRLEQVRDALQEIGIKGMSTYQAQGFGRQRGHKEIYRGAEYNISFQPKIMLEAVVEDGQVETAVEAIVKAARSGNIGDGKIFISPIEGAIRIRTGERDETAL